MRTLFSQRSNFYITLHVDQDQYSGEDILGQLGIRSGPPVIAFMGGAAKLDAANAAELERVIYDGVARAAVELKAIVIDGGTDSGTMGMLNAALRKHQHKGLYIGVAPEGLTHLPAQPAKGNRVSLGGAHTHFVLVNGNQWGDELESMYSIVDALAKNAPSIGILVNGGDGTLHEVEENVDDGRKIMVLEGSGRLADKISLQLHFPSTSGALAIKNVSQDGDFSVFDTSQNPDILVEKIKNYLKMI